jgi:hypothetical protein
LLPFLPTPPPPLPSKIKKIKKIKRKKKGADFILISTEMRHDVTTWSFLFRKAIDNILYGLSAGRPISVASLGPLLSRDPFPARDPGWWVPLYTMVTFRPDVSYSTAKRKAERQAGIISRIGWVVGIGGAVSLTISTGLVLQRWWRV